MRCGLRRAYRLYSLECKSIAISSGVIRDDFDPARIASIYQHYARRSLRSPTKIFSGADFLPVVLASAPQPILCKDFIIDPYRDSPYPATTVPMSFTGCARFWMTNSIANLRRRAQSSEMGVPRRSVRPGRTGARDSVRRKVVGINNRYPRRSVD
ncbi:hypothetical protein KCP78_07550 [Salmonella enterica subsp. enterica]|nr:hypothetical protein KCP78_07550 [Salmonella enterica subsp. enterica]